ncbi:MAG: TonB-dependent receptor [Robiginitomaculum sp.]|nr:MAG: TonB-dependent receptor [Robiginitomaculum sp.]
MTTSFLFRLASAGLLTSVSYSAMAQTQPTSAPEDEIIVTGSPLSRSIDEAITGASILTGDELANRLASTIGETLKYEPGVSSTFFGAGASRPIIRGQGGDRVRVLNNGIGSIDASSASPDHAVAAEPAQAERIEVLRGATVLRFGSSGSGGIVNVIDGRIPDAMPDGKFDGAFRIGASSVDSGREVAGSFDTAIGSNLVLHLDGTFKATDDYSIPGFNESARLIAIEEAEHEDEDHEGEDHEEEEHDDLMTGRLENSAVETKSLTGGLSYIGSRGYFGVALHRYESDYGIPGGHHHEEEHDEEEEEEEHHEEDEHDHEEEAGVTIALRQTRFDVNGSLELDGFFEKIQLFGGYADYTHTEFEGPGVVGTVFANEGYEARIEAIQTERGTWRAAYGGQIRHRDFSAIGEEAFVPPTSTDQIGIYTFQEVEKNDIHMEAAARYENTKHEVSGSTVERNFNLFSISAGGDIHLSDAFRMGGTVFRTERAPTTEELFSNGPHLATNQFERGDLTLGKEISTGVEAALRYRSDDQFMTANVFYTDYSDFIFETEIGEEEDGLSVFQFTSADANFKGFELHGGTNIGTLGSFTLKADALAEYVRAQTDTDNLPRIPPLSILAGLEASNDRLSLRAEVDYAAAQSTISALEIPTDNYALVNLFGTWKSPMDAQNVRISLSVLNLFNEDARQHTSFLKDVVPLPGRNIRFSISTAF